MSTTRELTRPPNMGTLYARAALPMLPGTSLLPGAARGEQLPDLELVLADVTVRPEHLAAYNRVCGFRLDGRLPPTYPHVLAFPLHMALMTENGFPFPPVGLVHVENDVTWRRPILQSEWLTLRVRAAGLRPHPKGQAFSLITEAWIGEERVWDEQSTMLRRGSGGETRPAGEEDGARSVEPLPVAGQWRVPADAGRRYAAVSGDRNPIHLHSLTARLFGFPRPIAHGMWTKARCLAFLEGRLPDAGSVSVRFRAPLKLPSRVNVASAASDGAIQLAVQDAQTAKPHLNGSVSTLPAATGRGGG